MTNNEVTNESPLSQTVSVYHLLRSTSLVLIVQNIALIKGCVVWRLRTCIIQIEWVYGCADRCLDTGIFVGMCDHIQWEYCSLVSCEDAFIHPALSVGRQKGLPTGFTVICAHWGGIKLSHTWKMNAKGSLYEFVAELSRSLWMQWDQIWCWTNHSPGGQVNCLWSMVIGPDNITYTSWYRRDPVTSYWLIPAVCVRYEKQQLY